MLSVRGARVPALAGVPAGGPEGPGQPVRVGRAVQLVGALAVEVELDLGVAEREHRCLLGELFFSGDLNNSREGAPAT
jgi:hypothetical protein